MKTLLVMFLISGESFAANNNIDFNNEIKNALNEQMTISKQILQEENEKPSAKQQGVEADDGVIRGRRARPAGLNSSSRLN